MQGNLMGERFLRGNPTFKVNFRYQKGQEFGLPTAANIATFFDIYMLNMKLLSKSQIFLKVDIQIYMGMDMQNFCFRLKIFARLIFLL